MTGIQEALAAMMKDHEELVKAQREIADKVAASRSAIRQKFERYMDPCAEDEEILTIDSPVHIIEDPDEEEHPVVGDPVGERVGEVAARSNPAAEVERNIFKVRRGNNSAADAVDNHSDSGSSTDDEASLTKAMSVIKKKKDTVGFKRIRNMKKAVEVIERSKGVVSNLTGDEKQMIRDVAGGVVKKIVNDE